MRKLFLTFVTALLCNVVSFAQSQFGGGTGVANDPYLISTKAQFEAIAQQSDGASGLYFRQTADINLGVYENRTSSIIPDFRGTYDGDGYTITYQASFYKETVGIWGALTEESNHSLFGSVRGTIDSLNVNAGVTLGGTANNMNVALLCGKLTSSGKITFCNVSGNVNSTINPTVGGGSDAGLIVGECAGEISYCVGSGNVVGVGYVGGLIGQMTGSAKAKGCSFVGSVNAVSPTATDLATQGSFAGGICGMASDDSSIDLCYVKADITGIKDAQGTTCSAYLGSLLVGFTNGNVNGGKADVTNCYVEGTINGDPIDSLEDIADNLGTINNNYYKGQDLPNNIASPLNGANTDSNINFEVINGEVVLVIGQQETILVCEAPSGLSITENEGIYTATWTMSGTDNSITEKTFYYTLTNNGETIQSGTITETITEYSVSTEEALLPSPTPYVFTVKADCHEADLYSDEISQSFMVECPKPTNLSVSEVSYSGFSVNYSATAKSKLTVGSTETVTESTGNLTQQIPGLLPKTEYTATVSVLCDEEYVESLSTTVTTSAVPAPTNLSAVAVWQENAGMVTISWSGEDGLTYEIEGEGVKESGFEKSGLAVGNYTARVRARYQNPNNSEDFYYSDWSEIAYTVSNPPAPSNPRISFAHQGNGTADVTITWDAGSEDSPTWIIKEGETQLATGLSSATYTISGRNVGSSFTIKISEKTTPGTSEPLLVNVTVPCANATLPESIETNQTTATFTFASEQTNRKIVIGGYEHDASSASVTLNLSSGTNYNYTIREYCTTTLYSEVSSTFVTKSCYAVTGLQAQATGVTSGSASWTSQSELSGLNYKVRLLQGANEISSTEQPETSITFSGLQPSTTYTVEVSEQCGDAYGDVRTIPFTTESSTFITKQSGNFNDPNIWTNGKVPQGDVAYITIAEGHIVTLTGDLTITPTYKIASNQGVLVIPTGKQLINTTGENVGGIIEVETPIKDQRNWHFVGAPFAGYKLEAIKPVTGSDVAITTFNYTTGLWHSSDEGGNEQWATYETWINEGEGYFAWQFYDGVMTFTTYGDLWVWDNTGTSGYNGSYNFNQPPLYKLNNDEEITVTESGNWIALANPYPFKLNVATFLSQQTGVQGGVRYKYNNENKTFTTSTSGEIGVTEGFFVNFTGNDEHEVKFKKTQRYAPSAKANAEREFIRLALVQGKREVELLFAQNEDAEQGYDIYDANKLFSPMGVAEPYFVTDGIALIKEEVRDLPYYATMNVRSQEDTVMNFVLTNLPEGYAVSIIDGEEVIDLVEGGVYSTEIASGENADRFKVLVKKNVGLADVEELDVRIINSNRHITITAQENVRTEVYNTLGQKVFETEETNFVLSGVASGAYVVKVQGAKASKSQKIVVE